MASTIKDIANQLGLSKSTVSYALNGRSKHVSEELRTKILEVAREIGYRPNEVARSLAIGRTHTIGFVPLSLERYALGSTFVQTALSAIYTSAEDSGLHILLPTGYNPSQPDLTQDRLFQARVDGIVLLTGEDSPMLRDFVVRRIPLAIVAGPAGSPGPTFNADNAGGARQAADHLVSLGHRHIALLGSARHFDLAERGDAFAKRLEEHGVELPADRVRIGDASVPGSYEAALDLLRARPRPTAVFCVNDHMAYGLIHAASRLGLSVPQDVSVVGFDDEIREANEVSALFLPALTTIRQPVAEMSRVAFDAIVRQIDGEPVESRVFPTQLIRRETTASL